jgi:hypothetical protein
MNKGKAWGLALAAFLLGLVLSNWWSTHTHTNTSVNPPVAPVVLPLPTTTVGDIRFTVFRAGRSQTRDEAGHTQWMNTFELVIENMKNHEASMDSLEIGAVGLVAGDIPLATPVRTKMNDKYTLPPGFPASLSENVRVVSCYVAAEGPTVLEPIGSTPVLVTNSKHYMIHFTYGPSQIPIELGPLVFP